MKDIHSLVLSLVISLVDTAVIKVLKVQWKVIAIILVAVDNTKLSLPKPNSLVDIVFPIVQKLLLNFMTIAHYPSWHFRDFKHVQQILQDEFRVPQEIFYHALPPLDYFTTHKPGNDCDKCNLITERTPSPHHDLRRRNGSGKLTQCSYKRATAVSSTLLYCYGY